MDGELSVIRAIRKVWPEAIIQRCLYHIQMQGMSWLRTYPKTQSGKELRYLLMSLCAIRSVKERNVFIRTYKKWFTQYRDFVLLMSKTSIALNDLKRTTALINNALSDMFHYLSDANIHHTTNALESFYSRLKLAYRQHRGLSHRHKLQYLSWYCYFGNQQKINKS